MENKRNQTLETVVSLTDALAIGGPMLATYSLMSGFDPELAHAAYAILPAGLRATTHYFAKARGGRDFLRELGFAALEGLLGASMGAASYYPLN